jgi:hypothetical protein
MGSGLFCQINSRKKRYQKLKENKELHKKEIERVMAYDKKNRKYKNEYSNNREKELREVSKSLGNCTKCHKPKEADKYNRCSSCRLIQREYYLKHYAKQVKKIKSKVDDENTNNN